MSIPSMQEKMRCPTCKATQEWSDTCRRCKCDLTLLWNTARAAHVEKYRCLKAIDDQRPYDALEAARHYLRIAGNDDARKLLAVCSFLCGQWVQTLQIAHTVRS